MEKLILTSKDAKKVKSLFEWKADDEGNKCYSLKLNDNEETIWCASIKELYEEIHKSNKK